MNEIGYEDIKLAIVALWNNKVLLILACILGLFSGMLYTSFTSGSNYYGATASVYSATFGSYQLTQTDVKTLTNYADVIESRKVSEDAALRIKETGINSEVISKSINIRTNNNSYIMEITAVNEKPDIAVKIVNAVAESFVAEVSRVTGNDSIQILDAADKPFIYRSSNLNKIRLFFIGVFFALVAGMIVLKSLFTNTLQSIKQCIDDEDELIGIIPESIV